MSAKTATLSNGVPARNMPPTAKHRVAIFPGTLGTVYAINDEGECRYFDYDREGAFAFAGVAADRDPRIALTRGRNQHARSGATDQAIIPVGTRCIWVRRQAV